MFEKQEILKELGKLHRIDQINFEEIGGMPTAKDGIIHVRKVRDWAMRQKSITGCVETVLTVIKVGAPFVETAVLTYVPAINIRQWSTVINELTDYMRGPVTEIWRQNMMMFGSTMNPWYSLGLLLFGSMVWVAVLNIFKWDPVFSTRATMTVAASFVGLSKTPAPRQASAVPDQPAMPMPMPAAATPRPTRPSVPQPEGRRKTMAKPS